MNTAEMIYQQVQKLPPFQAEQVLRFIDSLKSNQESLTESQPIEKERAIYLTSADMEFFFNVLENPQQANSHLKRAAQRHRLLISHAQN